MQSALYVGTLRHRRFAPRDHSFEYPVFLSFLDIDRLPELLALSPFSSYNRWNLTAYYERDHFGDPQLSLRRRLELNAARRGLQLPDGKIFLLTHLRYLGYVFNPVSFFYLYDRHENLRMILAEVNNTFGESHNYWLTPAESRPSNNARCYTTQKEMHVSPFMDMDLSYDWIFTEPSRQLVVHMNTVAKGNAFFDATLNLEHRPWTRRELHRVLRQYPFITLRVIAAIHWQAFQLWRKHLPVYTRPSRRKPGPAANLQFERPAVTPAAPDESNERVHYERAGKAFQLD